MPKRKVWSQEEDKILRHLREERGERKWETIARIMDSEFKIVGRSGKQCRERYHNHLDASIISTEWTVQEEETLLREHEEIGNKWSMIAQKLPGRSDNCVKNHFYSKLRKSLRKLNKLIEEDDRAPPIKLRTLYKIIEVQQTKFQTNSKVDEELADFCKGIKNRLFMLEGEGEEDAEYFMEEAQQLVGDIRMFENNHKRGFRGLKREQEHEEGKEYLKPPTAGIRRSSSLSSDRSDDSNSFLSSSSCHSLSDLSECDDNQKSKTTRSRRASSGVNSESHKDTEDHDPTTNNNANKEQAEVYFNRAEDLMGMRPEEFSRQHKELIGEEEIGNEDNFGQELFNGMMYEDTPVISRIFAPSLRFDDADFGLFPKDMHNEEEPLEYREADEQDY